MSSPALAAITLDTNGGGVAAVSRMLWQVMRDQWGSGCSLLTLVPRESKSLETGFAERARFGARLAWTQWSGGCSWVLCSHLGTAKAQALLPSVGRRRHAVFLHGIEAWRPLDATERRALMDAAAILVNSRYTAERARAIHPWLPPTAVCSLAIEPIVPSRGSVPRFSDWGPHAVLVVGRMAAAERYKGHDEVLDAWPAILAAVPDARLVFVGSGDDVDRLRDKARALGVANSLVVTGFVDDRDLDEAYRRAAVFAMPSRNEGFGLVYLEAMARGLPCIGSNIDAAGEIIRDGETGYLVDPSDRRRLAERLLALLADQPKRRSLGAAGQRRVNECFGYAQFRGRVVEVLEGALAAGPRTTAVMSPAD